MAELAALLDKAGSGGRGRRSGLSRWLRSHHDTFAAMLAEREPAWEDVATALAAMGLRDGTGKPPTGERVRKAWWDVRRAKAERAKRRAAVPPSLGPGEIAPAVVAVPPSGASGSGQAGAFMTPSEGVASRARMQLDIRPATPLHDVPASTIVPVLPVMPPASLTMETGATAGAAVSGSAPGTAAASSATASHAAERLRRLSEQMDAARTPLPKIVP